jgi:hypothetical protein
MSAEFAKRTIHLIGETQRAYAKRMIDEAPAGYVARIAEQTRSDAQNRMMWPLIADMQRQVPAYATFSAEDMKLRYLNALGTEMRFLPTLEGNGLFPIGQRSSTLSKSQFSALIELIFADGARHNVEWSHRSMDMIEEARAA